MTEMRKILYCPHCKRRENFWIYSHGLFCQVCDYQVTTKGEEKWLDNLAKYDTYLVAQSNSKEFDKLAIEDYKREEREVLK